MMDGLRTAHTSFPLVRLKKLKLKFPLFRLMKLKSCDVKLNGPIENQLRSLFKKCNNLVNKGIFDIMNENKIQLEKQVKLTFVQSSDFEIRNIDRNNNSFVGRKNLSEDNEASDDSAAVKTTETFGTVSEGNEKNNSDDDNALDMEIEDAKPDLAALHATEAAHQDGYDLDLLQEDVEVKYECYTIPDPQPPNPEPIDVTEEDVTMEDMTSDTSEDTERSTSPDITNITMVNTVEKLKEMLAMDGSVKFIVTPELQYTEEYKVFMAEYNKDTEDEN